MNAQVHTLFTVIEALSENKNLPRKNFLFS